MLNVVSERTLDNHSLNLGIALQGEIDLRYALCHLNSIV